MGIAMKILPEIQNHLVPLKPEEYAQLEKNILEFGCRDPLVLWEGVLIDGHNRNSICTKHKLPYRIVNMEFDNLDAVLEWVEDNQLGRRNLTIEQFRLLIGRKYNRLKLKQGGDRGNQYTVAKGQNDPLPTTAEAIATEHGVSEKTVKRAAAQAAQLDQGTPELQAAVMQGKAKLRDAAEVATLPKEQQLKALSQVDESTILQLAKEVRAKKAEAKRAERVEKIAAISAGNTELKTDLRYPVIYADPPWCYDFAETSNRDIENQYPTMSLEEICALKVPATDDAVLFLWTTAPKLLEGLEVMKAWGFGYRTCAIWDKQKMGMGYYFRVQHEMLLIGVRGNIPTPQAKDRQRSIISEPYSGHSKKPVTFYDIIDRMYPEYPKIELFCRKPQPGWDVWGNQSHG